MRFVFSARVHYSTRMRCSLPLVLVLAACGAPSEPAKPAPPATATVGSVTAPAPPAPVPPSASAPPAVAAGPCGGQCPGHVGNALVDAIGKRAKQARRCYESALATDAALRGRVQIRITIGSDGKVCEATASSDTKPMEPVATCVAALFRSAETALPPPEGGCAVVNAPINFVPTPDAGAP